LSGNRHTAARANRINARDTFMRHRAFKAGDRFIVGFGRR
jgi:hypothetical protein